MKSINEVRLLGNVTKDPEVKETPAGTKVATFGLATNYVYTNKAGEKVETPEFHNLVLWGNLAEIAEKYVKKGAPIHVSGRIQTRSWDKDDGTKAYRTEIIVSDLVMVGGKKSDSEERFPEFDAQPEAAPKKKHPKIEEEISIADIPF